MESAFTAHDRSIAHRQKSSLRPLAAKILHLRYWHCQTIEEIAHQVRRDWDGTFALLRGAEAAVKEGCLANPAFSRSANAAEAS